MEMKHEEQEESFDEQAPAKHLTARDLIDIAIVFGSIPALLLNVIFWAVATAFSGVAVLPTVLALLITLLLTFTSLLLLIRYVDVCVTYIRKAEADPKNSEEWGFTAFGAGIVCGFLAIDSVVCLAMAGNLETAHYLLIVAQILLVGYQTWRVFHGKQL